ncbi:MAG: hypothetical protein AB1489_16285 [Acidobacteriota bacterium]
MSDYLKNLVAKSLSRTEVVQPRLASLFEPSSPVEGVSHNPFSIETESVHERQSFNEKPFETTFTPIPNRTVQPNLQREAVSNSNLFVANPVDSAAQPYIQPISTDKVESVSQPESLSDIDSSQPLSVHTTISQTPIDRVKPVDASEQRDQPLLKPMAKPVVSEPSILNQTSHTESLESMESASNIKSIQASTIVPPTASPITQRQDLSPVRPIITMAPELEMARITELSTPAKSQTKVAYQPLPTIKVTIGRVDVRAIMSTSPTPRTTAPPAAQSLSLQDYLKQRGGSK